MPYEIPKCRYCDYDGPCACCEARGALNPVSCERKLCQADFKRVLDEWRNPLRHLHRHAELVEP